MKIFNVTPPVSAMYYSKKYIEKYTEELIRDISNQIIRRYNDIIWRRICVTIEEKISENLESHK